MLFTPLWKVNRCPPHHKIPRSETPNRHGVRGQQDDAQIAMSAMTLRTQISQNRCTGPSWNKRQAKSRAKRLLRQLGKVFSFDTKSNENEKDAKRTKDIVRQMVGISMIAAAQAEIRNVETANEEDAKIFGSDMLQAFRMLDIYDTSYFDSLFTKFKNWFTSEQESTAGREIFKSAMSTAACGGIFSETFSTDCTAVLSTVASIASAKLGLGTPSTYRVRALVEFIQTYLDNLQDSVKRFDQDKAGKVYDIVNTATAQVQCVLQLFGAYYDFKSPVTMKSPDGKEQHIK